MEGPAWERGDTVRSVRAVFGMAKAALARFITNVSEFPSRVDEKHANALNEDDE